MAEAAMTREQVLEEALRQVQNADDIDAACDIAEAALASTQQEPAPAADADEVREAWVEEGFFEDGGCKLLIETPAQVCEFRVGPHQFAGALAKAINEHVKLAALRRYAGDGVTDAEVNAFCKAMGCTGNPNFSRSVRNALEAAARAKSSEKGGADD